MLAIEDANAVSRAHIVQLAAQLHEFRVVEIRIPHRCEIRKLHVARRGGIGRESRSISDHSSHAAVTAQGKAGGYARPSGHPRHVAALFVQRKPLLRILPHSLGSLD